MNFLIFGASGGIGLALVEKCIQAGDSVTAITRKQSDKLQQLKQANPAQITIIQAEVSDWQASLTHQLDTLFQAHGLPDIVINTIGLLHDKTAIAELMPEKRLQEVRFDFFQQNMTVNCFTCLLITQYLSRLYRNQDKFCFTALSALVGSISENTSGGWYSYRMSKAALHMFIKTLSIEWKRLYPNATVLAVHPGTTDTPLSQPFQANIDKDKLYSPAETAKRIINIVKNAEPSQSGCFLFWDGTPKDW
ncbi:putative short chain dehydrogenase [Photobacterium marinum]|uniref:Putative short chain dehydrogenase n=2 Tax=Photobacterium marinum TaxID=1056511 RepID=L8J4I4_9GAMM|nr:putative short chain dehydrogenase [Photobacterium marinum]